MKCALCDAELKGEEATHPSRDADGDPVCETCYYERCTDGCSRCEERVDLADLDTSPGQLIVLLEKAPALATDDLPAGYYRVLRWPIYADGMIEGYFFSDALARVADLDEQGLLAAKDAGFMSGPMCSACRAEVERLAAPPAAGQGATA